MRAQQSKDKTRELDALLKSFREEKAYARLVDITSSLARFIENNPDLDPAPRVLSAYVERFKKEKDSGNLELIRLVIQDVVSIKTELASQELLDIFVDMLKKENEYARLIAIAEEIGDVVHINPKLASFDLVKSLGEKYRQVKADPKIEANELEVVMGNVLTKLIIRTAIENPNGHSEDGRNPLR